ncbi:hypothetical protein H8356DRAFT_1351858 [Neocallimastix lanati (nom. inval.)]|nr:hypothetical protein H8356DRAFT_1351858 [Neocallimastix sp. JGI-2020a]
MIGSSWSLQKNIVLVNAKKTFTNTDKNAANENEFKSVKVYIEVIAIAMEMFMPKEISTSIEVSLELTQKNDRSCLLKFMKNIKQENATSSIKIQLAKIMNKFNRRDCAELEDIIDIPGTVGGGIIMNATFMPNRLLKLTSRGSLLKGKKYLVIEATFKLKKGNLLEIQKAMTNNTELRYQKQPMYYGSAGSFFVWDHIEHGSMYEKYKKIICAANVINVIRHIEKVIKDNYDIDMKREVVVLDTFNWINYLKKITFI